MKKSEWSEDFSTQTKGIVVFTDGSRTEDRTGYGLYSEYREIGKACQGLGLVSEPLGHCFSKQTLRYT